ncbi:hypothetical protein CGZ95_08890 [Enemella evansiae]|uniref:hypothetical protein n=1 Tax=Enemella evansiae TaxID=2016499 RepID=UPI000B968E75|nr:hypothetical protein [Enemella evansiae]OYO00728.1 hypothetical protein CGZ95_08890 [Enemella evansiae]
MTDISAEKPSGDSDRPIYENHTHVTIGGARGWNILFTLLVTAGLTVLAYQLSLSGFAEMAASGVSIFLVTLVGYLFKAGILRLPEKGEDDDLAFTKSTLRRIYDEIQQSIARSSMFKLVLYALAYTAGFMILRAGVAFGISLLTSMWVAIGVGLIVGGLVVAQDQILSWIRTSMVKRRGER